MSKTSGTETLADLFRPHTHSRIAAGVGVSPRTVSAWKNGQTDLFHAYIAPLAQFLQIDRSRVIGACFASTGRPPIGP